MQVWLGTFGNVDPLTEIRCTITLSGWNGVYTPGWNGGPSNVHGRYFAVDDECLSMNGMSTSQTYTPTEDTY